MVMTIAVGASTTPLLRPELRQLVALPPRARRHLLRQQVRAAQEHQHRQLVPRMRLPRRATTLFHTPSLAPLTPPHSPLLSGTATNSRWVNTSSPNPQSECGIQFSRNQVTL